MQLYINYINAVGRNLLAGTRGYKKIALYKLPIIKRDTQPSGKKEDVVGGAS